MCYDLLCLLNVVMRKIRLFLPVHKQSFIVVLEIAFLENMYDEFAF